MGSLRLLLAIFFCASALFEEINGFERIIGGIETTVEKRPYQASLQYFWPDRIQHLCGASIINSKHLLSAAHCDPGSNLPILHARVGSTSYKEGGQVLKVKTFETHPNYKVEILDYDIAIISFEEGENIIFGANVRVIPLAYGDDPEDGSLLTVSGWGVIADTSNVASLMMNEVQLPLVNGDRCRLLYTFLTSRQMCLGGTPQGGTSSCFGDSGGPAIQNGIQYGVVSGVYSGVGCSAPNVPGLYAKVSSVRDWIQDLAGL
ncbi:trypsin-3-like [Arctopsyche grandis]|uniref:trypsin-3-like n=1 Tax=Arctopsyche grandis TaxID=121162 RepID=UPI00406D79BA